MTATVTDLAWEACNRRGAMQQHDELRAVVDVVRGLAPAVVVEIGCGNGGTLWLWRQLAERVYGITLPNRNPAYPDTHGATVHLGDSHNPEALQWLQDQLDGAPIDLLHIDGDHTYDGVAADYAAFAPLVRPGGLVLIHDIANHRDPDMGVPRFWADLEHPQRDERIISPLRPIGFGLHWKENA